MLVKFRGKFFQIPDPEPEKDEIVVRVEKYICLPTPNDPKGAMFRFSNKFAKIKFFFIHEGPLLTYHKVRSSLIQRSIISEKKLVLTYGPRNNDGQYVFAIGPQDCPASEYHLFPARFSVQSESSEDFDYIYNILMEYFDKNPKQLSDLYFYSKYSGIKIDFDLKKILENNTSTSWKYKQVKIESFDTKISNKKLSAQKKINHNSTDFPELFLVGAGAYSCAYILPLMKKVNYNTLVDLNPILSNILGEKYGFKRFDTSTERGLSILSKYDLPILIIATYHSTHVPIAEYALSLNPKTRIMIEKPPVTDIEQLRQLVKLRKKDQFIEIGYNRRYSRFIKIVKKILTRHEGPLLINCIIREKGLPISHWYYWPTQGTRIVGNICHWIDLGVYLIQKKPITIFAKSVSKKHPTDEPIITILFEDFSALNIIASEKGNSLRGIQEIIDIRRDDLTITIDDFMRMKIQEGGQEKIFHSIIRDKGHKEMYNVFQNNIDKGSSPIYNDNDLILSSLLYLKIKDMLFKNEKYIELNDELNIQYGT